MGELELLQIDDGWLLVNLKVKEGGKFMAMLEDMKRTLHVFVYDNSYKKYKAPPHEIPRIAECCERNDIAFFASSKIIRVYKRQELKYKRSAEIKKSRKAYHKIKMDLPYWTKDKSIRLFDYQKLAVDLITYNRRYLLADDMGCLGKNAQIIVSGRTYTLEEAYHKFHRKCAHKGHNWNPSIIPCRTRSLFDDQQFYLNHIQDIKYSGVKATWKVFIKTDKKKYSLRLTPDHELLTESGWRELQSLDTGDQVFVNGKDLKWCASHSEHSKKHPEKRKHLPYTIPELGTIYAIKKDNLRHRTYDLVMKDPARNFIANGVVVHNCGKTPQAVAIMLKSWEDYGFCNALIIAPNRLMGQWKSEIMKFSTLRTNTIEILGDRKCYTGETDHFLKRRKECQSCKFFEQCNSEFDDSKISAHRFRALQIKRAKVLIASYSSLTPHENDYIRRKFEVVIFDEASKIKNHMAKVTRSARKIIHSLPIGHVVVPMSGTFIENRVAEMHSVIDIISPQYLGNFASFKGRYLYTDHFGNVTGIRREAELKEKLDRICLRRTIDEVWKDRPEIVETYIDCVMEPPQAKVYAQAREGALKQLKDLESQNKINQANVGALITYLLMTACTLKSIDPDTPIKNHSSKIDVLKDIILEEFPENAKMIIFSRFTNKVTPYLLEEMGGWGIGKILFAGAGDQRTQDKVIHDFKNNDKNRFMVCSDAFAYGANFQNANYLVNFDLPWNPAVLDQRIRRVYRRGQHRNVTIMNLVVPGTVEEDLVQVLRNKRETFAKFLKVSMADKQDGARPKPLSLSEMIKLI